MAANRPAFGAGKRFSARAALEQPAAAGIDAPSQG